jgi:hypothetical protein
MTRLDILLLTGLLLEAQKDLVAQRKATFWATYWLGK